MKLENKYDEKLDLLRNKLEKAYREIYSLKETLYVLKAFQEHSKKNVCVSVHWEDSVGSRQSVSCLIEKGAFPQIIDCVKHSANEKEKDIDLILGVDGE